jgi:hypothetical protein
MKPLATSEMAKILCWTTMLWLNEVSDGCGLFQPAADL